MAKVGMTEIIVKHTEPYAGKDWQVDPFSFEVVNFDQAQRDAILDAIQFKKAHLKQTISTDKVRELVQIYKGADMDIVQLHLGHTQSEINRLESVENFFSAYRFNRDK